MWRREPTEKQEYLARHGVAPADIPALAAGLRRELAPVLLLMGMTELARLRGLPLLQAKRAYYGRGRDKDERPGSIVDLLALLGWDSPRFTTWLNRRG